MMKKIKGESVGKNSAGFHLADFCMILICKSIQIVHTIQCSCQRNYILAALPHVRIHTRTDFSSVHGYVYWFSIKYWLFENKYGFSKFIENLTRFQPKILIILKSASNTSCTNLNFLRKTHWMHISILPSSGGRGLQTFATFEWCNRMEK